MVSLVTGFTGCARLHDLRGGLDFPSCIPLARVRVLVAKLSQLAASAYAVLTRIAALRRPETLARVLVQKLKGTAPHNA